MGVYKPDRKGLEDMVSGSMFESVLMDRAAFVAEAARETAPYDAKSQDEEHFRDSIKTRTEGDYLLSKTGKAHRARVAYVYSDDPAALSIETGTKNTPAHNTLSHALHVLGGE